MVICSECDQVCDWTSEYIMTNKNEENVQDYLLTLCNESRSDFESNYAVCKFILYVFPMIWDYIAKSIENYNACKFICNNDFKIIE